MKQTQLTKLERLIRKGATAMEIVSEAGTVSPHRRLFELRQRGWQVWREAIPGKRFGRYFGRGPEVA